MQEAGPSTPQDLPRIQRPRRRRPAVPLHARLRCYLPSTSAILLIVAIAYIALHSTTSHSFAGFGLATEIVIGFGLAGLATGTIVISAVSIRRRRAAAGACHACSHPCRGALVPLPEIDARSWPHRSLSQQPLPLTVISAQPQRAALASVPGRAIATRPAIPTQISRAYAAESARPEALCGSPTKSHGLALRSSPARASCVAAKQSPRPRALLRQHDERPCLGVS
jgi:hypothetical protein